MLFVRSLLVAASALASLAAAQSKVIKFTKVPNIVTAGNAYPIEWTTTDNTTPITIKLRVGGFNNLQDVSVLTTDASGGKYTWTPDKGLGDNSYYALEIIQGKEINYSAQISLSGGSTSSLIATASASAASASSASSASESSASESSASSASASSASASATGTTLSTATITGSSPSATASAASKTASHSSDSLTAATTKTTGTASSTESAISAPTSTGAADRIIMGSSPLALIFGAVAAMVYLN
ncbi:uncharacterized protein BDZ99DRAFT_522093 [Mytilinidion resinicola]|uniref:Yeast cell wall synthesis Kre9/Knh1-like N-terminal domain-containing protein n=1 Tax=Mytilinidion resinicola TaxID=574789 RepID=A0A6A6YID4_9PEZI|nr:uncharacterized protein BDZ99DRAFT_522093 [Mytilinidion resinicola]KAF2808550.1 hypothetical protein BDZ99DRAFT_522093 [Mytilinidion resinicola]